MKTIQTQTTHCQIIDGALDSDNEEERFAEEEKEEEEGLLKLATCVFSASKLATLQKGIGLVKIPSWIDCPPVNLGEASHGKLKADEWMVLFLVMSPLILPEIWSSTISAAHTLKLFENFYHLTICTYIISAYSTSDEQADCYTHHYVQYRKLCLELFPAIPTRPNHHMALHNGNIMKFWGPLPPLSELPYERHNGSLQKINTNNKLGECLCSDTLALPDSQWNLEDLDYTMLSRICSQGRLHALLLNMQHLASRLDEPSSSSESLSTPLSFLSETAALLGPRCTRADSELAHSEVDHSKLA